MFNKHHDNGQAKQLVMPIVLYYGQALSKVSGQRLGQASGRRLGETLEKAST